MPDMKCTGEKCPIPELTKGVTACTARDCKHRTPPMPDIKKKLVDIIQRKPYNMSEVSAGRLADHLIANGVTVHQWISVEERLPEIGVRVLLLDKHGHILERELYRFIDGFLCFRPDGLVPGKHITHWMPLPEPPKED